MEELQYEFTCEAAPVQAEGFVAGKPFYFRSRHQHWSFAVSEDLGIDPVEINQLNHDPERGFYVKGSFGQKAFDASYMSLDVAASIIQSCATEYLQSRRNK
jgi:hypothetical protein